MYVINIDIENNNEQPKSIDLISDLKSLTMPSKSMMRDNPFEDEVSLNSIVKKNKKKKKEKKKDKKKKNPDIELIDDIDPDLADSDEQGGFDLIDLEELLNDEREQDIEGDIVGFQKNNYDKLKKGENPYKKEFAEELTLLYNLLDDVTKYGKKLEKKYDSMENAKTRGVSKYTMELANSILQGKTSKLQIIKEIASIKKTIADLKIKADGKNNKNDANGGMSNDALAVSYLQNIIKHGRTSFVNALTKGPEVNDDDDQIEIEGWDMDSNPDAFNYDNYQSTIEERLAKEKNVYRDSPEGDKYIEYEHMGVKLYIKRCIDTGDWEMVALDKNQQQIYDYPIPDASSLGKMKFTDDGAYASDKFGRTYKVIEYISEP